MENENFSVDGFEQFISSEITDTETLDLIYNFVVLDNFRYGEYEGNEYIVRKININHIQLENAVGTEQTKQPTIEVFTKGKFLSLLRLYKPTF